MDVDHDRQHLKIRLPAVAARTVIDDRPAAPSSCNSCRFLQTSWRRSRGRLTSDCWANCLLESGCIAVVVAPRSRRSNSVALMVGVRRRRCRVLFWRSGNPYARPCRETNWRSRQGRGASTIKFIEMAIRMTAGLGRSGCCATRPQLSADAAPVTRFP